MDRSAYEKLSIRDSARSLKKYGSTSSKHVTKNENYIKHYVSNSDTLQGIALKYDVTIEQIRRVNRLFASDSLFLKEYLLIPSQIQTPQSAGNSSSEPTPASQVTSPTSNGSFDDDSIDDFLGKIDASIASTKAEVKKTRHHSEFASSSEYSSMDRRKPAVSRLRQTTVNNNNGSSDIYSPPQAIVVQQGKKVKSSLRHHERQQDELFEL